MVKVTSSLWLGPVASWRLPPACFLGTPNSWQSQFVVPQKDEAAQKPREGAHKSACGGMSPYLEQSTIGPLHRTINRRVPKLFGALSSAASAVNPTPANHAGRRSGG